MRTYQGPFNRKFDSYEGRDVKIVCQPNYTINSQIQVTQGFDFLFKQKVADPDTDNNPLGEKFLDANGAALRVNNPYIFDDEKHSPNLKGQLLASKGDSSFYVQPEKKNNFLKWANDQKIKHTSFKFVEEGLCSWTTRQ